MPRIDLLPGVSRTGCEPAIVCDAHSPIAQARRRADWRDATQLLLLGAVDFLFLDVPSTHVPGLSRDGSFTLLIAANVGIVFGIWLTREIPRWTARRIASSWCPSERSRSRL